MRCSKNKCIECIWLHMLYMYLCLCIYVYVYMYNVYHRWARNSVKHESDIAFKSYLSLIEDRFLYCFMILIALEISSKSLRAICKMLNQIRRNFAIDKLSKLLPGWILYSPVFYITFNALNDNAQWDMALKIFFRRILLLSIASNKIDSLSKLVWWTFVHRCPPMRNICWKKTTFTFWLLLITILNKKRKML